MRHKQRAFVQQDNTCKYPYMPTENYFQKLKYNFRMRIDLTDDLNYMQLISPEYPVEIQMMEEALTAELPDSYIL